MHTGQLFSVCMDGYYSTYTELERTTEGYHTTIYIKILEQIITQEVAIRYYYTSNMRVKPSSRRSNHG